ncbi:hypothetical protein P3S68_000805 [Capsicum galapagoense]
MEDDDIIVIDAEPTSDSLPPSTSATAVDLSFLREDDDVDSTFLSLSPPFSKDSAGIHAESISDSLPPPSSNSGATTVVDLAFMLEEEDIDPSFLSLSLPFYENLSNPTVSPFQQVSKNPSEPTLSLFPEFSENLSASKNIANSTPPPSSSAAYTPVQCSIDSQDSSVLGNPSHKRCLFQESGEEKFFKKIKVTKDSTPEERHWITKPLTKSDVNGCSRLLLPRREVKNYVLPFMDEEQQYTICNDSCGIDVTVFDVDTQTEHSLTFKKWNGNFYLIKAWTAEFCKEKESGKR